LRHFLKDVQKLNDANVKQQLNTVISEIKAANHLTDLTQVKKLRGHSEAYRIRIGKYRLGFYFTGTHVEFARFAKREDIYKLFP
jgi:mRNA-degrading endonuclease RelE of RelBE toxin-antitoxin system